MSVTVSSRVFWTEFEDLKFEQKGKLLTVGKPSAKLVLLAIADNADDFGENSWQSFETLAKKASIERRSVMRVVKALIANKYISINGITRYGTNDYKINLAKLGHAPQARERTGRPKSGDSGAESGDRNAKSGDSGAESGDLRSPESSFNRKKTIDMLTLTRKILEGSMTIENAIAAGVPVTEDMRKAAEARDQAPKSFEAALGFSKPLPWWSSKEWTTFSVWVVEQYIADARIFEKFEAWRNTPFVKGSISNQRIRGFVAEFYDAFDMFSKTIKKDEPEYIPPVVDSPYAQTADTVFAPMTDEQKAEYEAVRARMRAQAAKSKHPA